jgi:hypothetical protein
MSEIIITGYDPEDFFNKIRKIVEEANSQNTSKIEKGESPKYATREDAAKALKISVVTLWDYTRRGLIKSKKIGSRILYLWTDIHDAVIDIENKKWR